MRVVGEGLDLFAMYMTLRPLMDKLGKARSACFDAFRPPLALTLTLTLTLILTLTLTLALILALALALTLTLTLTRPTT